MVLLIINPFLNGYFIGNIYPTFSDKPIWHLRIHGDSLWNCRRPLCETMRNPWNVSHRNRPKTPGVFHWIACFTYLFRVLESLNLLAQSETNKQPIVWVPREPLASAWFPSSLRCGYILRCGLGMIGVLLNMGVMKQPNPLTYPFCLFTIAFEIHEINSFDQIPVLQAVEQRRYCSRPLSLAAKTLTSGLTGRGQLANSRWVTSEGDSASSDTQKIHNGLSILDVDGIQSRRGAYVDQPHSNGSSKIQLDLPETHLDRRSAR